MIYYGSTPKDGSVVGGAATAKTFEKAEKTLKKVKKGIDKGERTW